MKPEIKKLLILNLPYLLFVWLFDKVGAAVRLSPGADASAKLLHLGDGFTAAFSSIAPSFHPADLALGIAGAVIVRLIIYTKGKNAKKYRRGTEYGSARWGGADDIKPYTDPVFENNIPLTQTERLTMNSRPKQPKYARNKNILVIGGSGSGKTRFFVKPSLMQCTSKDFPTSYIVTDPKGTLILETGKMLQRYKYRIKVLNTINFKKSMKYNPFAYLRSEKDILKLVNTIIANTKGDGEKSGEDFWVKAEKLYYTALIGYIWYEAPEDEKNFTTLLEMINASEAREDDEDFQNPVDLMFERLEEKDPEHFAVKQYKKYKLAAGDAAVFKRPDPVSGEHPVRIFSKVVDAPTGGYIAAVDGDRAAISCGDRIVGSLGDDRASVDGNAATITVVARADAYACHSKRIAFRQGKGFGTDDAAVDGDAAALPAVVDLTAVGVAKLNLAIKRPADGGGRILSLGADIAAVDDDRALAFADTIVACSPARTAADAGHPGIRPYRVMDHPVEVEIRREARRQPAHGALIGALSVDGEGVAHLYIDAPLRREVAAVR